MGSSLSGIIEEGYHVEEEHIYNHFTRKGVKPHLPSNDIKFAVNLPNHHAVPAHEYS